MKRFATGAAVIGYATLLAAIRSRVLLVAVAFAVILVGLSVVAASVSIGEQARLIIDVGLAAASGVGSVIAITLTINAYSSEIKNRTVYTVLTRPIPKASFLVGKYLGVVATMLIISTLMVFATAVMVWGYGDSVPSVFWSCLWLTWVEMAVVVAVALLFSSMATPALAATYTAGVWIAGNLAQDLQVIAARIDRKEGAGSELVRLAYYVLPDLQNLSLRTQAANYLDAPAEFVINGTLYGGAYAVFALTIATILFARRRTI